MLVHLGILSFIFTVGVGDLSSNYFCADMNPQPHVIIDQLMGMWFGIEIINHQEESHYIRAIPSCPIIHISEDKVPSSTVNPLHRNYNYAYNYGAGHGYSTNRPYGVSATQQDYRRKMKVQDKYEYDRQTTYGDHNEYPSDRVQHYDLGRQPLEMRYLRLYWDENGESTEFHMRYNVSRAGFWITSGPEYGGASLDPRFSHFAGTIQVLKAVGNHLLLTFCHQLPDRQLYSILLSRQLQLDTVEVHGVHNMLNRKGLMTSSIRKVCSTGVTFKISTVLFLLSVTYGTLRTFVDH